MKQTQTTQTKFKCEFCSNPNATESITESDTGREVHVCLECVNSMDWSPESFAEEHSFSEGEEQ